MTCHASYRRGERFCPLDGGAIVVEGEATDDPLIGRTIDDRYLVRRLLGRGGMGAVYAADHLGLDKPVAIKFVVHHGTDRTVRARFRQEARAASKVVHEHVVQIFDVGDDDELDYIVMEYVEGKDLKAVLAEGLFDPARAVAVIRQVLLGLSAIHEAGIVHRDIKPANILVTTRRPDFIKIMDFGIAKRLGGTELAQTDTGTGRVIGTPQYMAPEQLAGDELDHRADLYAAGVTLFAMVTGTVPFAGTSASKLGDVLNTPAPSLESVRPDLPPELVAAVARALETYPDDRFANAQAFAEALDGMSTTKLALAATAVAPTPDTQPTAPQQVTPSRREPPTAVDRPAPSVDRASRRTWLYGGATVVLVVAAIALIAKLRGADSAPPVVPGDAALAVVVAAPEPIAVAHAAEAKGDLARAIAAYEEVYAATRAPESLFRIADLYERLGATERAVLNFERYLVAAPDAPDRSAVATRLAKLRAQIPTMDPASRRKVSTSGQAKPVQPCEAAYARRCIRIVGTETEVLCKAVTTQRCSCESDADSHTLCPIPMSDVGGVFSCSAPRSADCLFLMGSGVDTSCNQFYFTGGTGGTRCEGYEHKGIRLPGKVECTRCAGTDYAGVAHEACAGFDGETGRALSGVLSECVLFGK